MTESGDAAPGAQFVGDHGNGGALVQNVEQQSVRETAGRSVQGPFEDAEARRHGRVRVGAGRRGHPYRERRGGEVVVDEQPERRVQYAQ